MLGYKMASFEKLICIIYKMSIFDHSFEKSILLEANRLEPRSGPTFVGPDLDSSLLEILQKYWWISILNKTGKY